MCRYIYIYAFMLHVRLLSTSIFPCEGRVSVYTYAYDQENLIMCVGLYIVCIYENACGYIYIYRYTFWVCVHAIMCVRVHICVHTYLHSYLKGDVGAVRGPL